MNPINDCPRVGPFMGVQWDKIVAHGDKTFRVVLYAAYNAFGLIGPEMNGIAVLNEDQHNVVLDQEACAGTGYFGASEAQKKRFDEVVAMPWEAFKAWVNAHKNRRYEI